MQAEADEKAATFKLSSKESPVSSLRRRPLFTNLKNRFEHVELPAKLLDYFTRSTANPTWGDIFESSKLKARTSLLPRFSEKRRSSFEL